MKIFNNKIKKTINDTLGIDNEIINEAYSSQKKSFKINTDLLTPSNINNHISLYHDYVSDFNQTSAKLDTADKSLANQNHSSFRSLKNDETYNMNAAYLHELYFANISDVNSEITMDSLSYMRLQRDFGSFDDWQRDFLACCSASRCGWVITYLNTYTQKYMNCVIDLHSQNVPVGFYPVIVMDVWQHAYYRDYLKDVKLYSSAMMKELNWRVVENRIKKADKIIEILRGE